MRRGMAEGAGARAMRFGECARLLTAKEESAGPAREPLIAPDDPAAGMRADAKKERISGTMVAGAEAASSTNAPHELGMGRLDACPCGMGMLGIGILRIGMLCCWQQACKFTDWH